MAERPTERASPRSEGNVARLLPVDALRGLLMALMALDHANHFIAQQQAPGEYWGGQFPVYPSVLAFLTRWVTHFCAPGFFFLMGVGMVCLAVSRRHQSLASRWAIVRHFWVRGALLIVLQLLVENRAWQLSTGGWGLRVYIGVLFALGCCMILGSLLMWLEPKWLLALSAGLALATEWLTPASSQWNRPLSALARLLLVPGGDPGLWANYPVLPWLGLTCLGMAFGYWVVHDPWQAFVRALRLGVALVASFLALRYFNGFGNIRPRADNTWTAFLNVVKYPPSIVFQLLTLGGDLALLGLLARAGAALQPWLEPLVVLGRVPLLFYVLHLFLYAILGLLLTPHGATIPQMYAYWVLGLLILYPACAWYGRFKHRQPAQSVWHLL